MENTHESLYGECRCCLSEGNHSFINKEYIHNGVREVYLEMFLEYMNLFLVDDPRLPILICSPCVQRLRDVRNFRNLVTRSEHRLLQAFDKNSSFVEESNSEIPALKQDGGDIKTEEVNNEYLDLVYTPGKVNDLKTEPNNSPCHSDTGSYNDEQVENFDDSKRKVKCGGKKKTVSGKTRSRIKKSGSESDIPIAFIKNLKDTQRKKGYDIQKKQDNKKLRENMTTILKYSTIMPFKNNFKTQYNCFYCEKHYTTFPELKEHILKHHSDISEATIDKCLRTMQDLILSADVSLIKCRQCDVEFKTIECLIEHLNKIHGKVFHETERKPSHGILGYNLSTDTLKCHICSKEFAFFKNLTVHMNEHYGLFVCYICGKKFLSEHRMKCHIFSHHDSKNTKCKHCGEVFKTEASKAYHIKKEHLKRTIKCPQCPQTFPFTNYVKRLNHMAAVHGIKKPQFKCDICGKEYANSGSLGAHKRNTHKRTKEHRCDICGYITVHNTVMKQHMDVHNGIKNYECQFCNKKFGKPYTLKLHLKIHLNDKKHACSLCEAAFIQKNSLKNHIKARHPDSGIDVNKL